MFRIEGPAIVSFSGGRTSGMMLHEIVKAHGGELPPDVRVVFTNTGKEFAQTLNFVAECAARWRVGIVWLERRAGGAITRVDHATASRKGEPFQELIADRKYLPNPVQRLCTYHLKVDLVRRWVLAELGWDHWVSVLGFRADEPGRVGGTSARWDVIAPLRDAGVTRDGVMAFWAAQPFDLQLRWWESNCDLCFLKGHAKRERIARDHPDTPDWWIRQERAVANTKGKLVQFRSSGPSYEAIKQRASLPMLALADPNDDIDDLGDCTCTD